MFLKAGNPSVCKMHAVFLILEAKEAAEVTEARMEAGAEDEGEVEAVWGHPGACVPLHHGLWVVTDNKYSFYVTKVRWHQAPGGNCSVSVTAG